MDSTYLWHPDRIDIDPYWDYSEYVNEFDEFSEDESNTVTGFDSNNNPYGKAHSPYTDKDND